MLLKLYTVLLINCCNKREENGLSLMKIELN